jgi:hypothetical protein
MKIRIEDISAELVRFVAQIKEARCKASKDGIANLQFDEEFTFQMEVITTDGLNAFDRPDISVAEPVESRSLEPEKIQRQEAGEQVSESVAAGFVSTSVSVKTEKASTTRQTTPEKESITTQESEPTVEVQESTEEQNGETLTGTSGGDSRTTINTFE